MEGTRAATLARPPLDTSARFRVLGELGRGGKGVVLLVLDRLRGETLALKRLRHTSGMDVRQMKREFRAIEGIAHENIVKVYELGLDEKGPYILMEALTGADLLTFCRMPGQRAQNAALADASEDGWPRAPTTLEQTTLTLGTEGAQLEQERRPLRSHVTSLANTGMQRLHTALPQLLSALECLHQHGLVHRDLKPANVFVRQDQVVKLLDFGILGEAGSASVNTLQGTAAYVAPEQIRGEPPAPSNDLYALGVVLFEVVTGHLPFNASSRGDLLLQHLHVPALQVHALAPECSAWLAQLIDGLLIKDPAERLTLAQARTLCAQHVAGYAAAVGRTFEPRLLEREHEQVALLDVLDATDSTAFQYIGISGASGVGKSALLGWTRSAVRRRQLTLFESRARFSERVPFNAIDGLVDDLASTLERFPELVADAEGQRLCAQGRVAFPVLASGLVSGLPQPALERKSVFDALIDLLCRCTRITGRLMLLCDDLQWADADSASFLERMLSLRPSSITLIATLRDDMHSAAFASLSQRVAPDLNFALRPLSEQALAHIIDGIARDLGRPVDPTTAQEAASGCDGRPLLAVVSGRVVGTQPADAAAPPLAWLLTQYAARGANERLLLSLLTAIDNEAALVQLARVTALHGGAVEQALSPLLHEGLITAAGRIGDERSYDFGHDLIRSHSAELLGPGAIKRAHVLVADDAEHNDSMSAAQRVRHLLGAERFARAAEVARLGADEAERANAFGLAVELYGIAITHGDGCTSLRESRAFALERSGRYLEAADEWSQLAALRGGGPRRDALLQQAKTLLAAGDIRQGRTILRRAHEEGSARGALPGPLTNLAALGRLMLGPRALPGGTRIAPHGVSSAADERDVFLGTMIGYFDPIGGLRHMMRARGAYRAAGNRIQAAEVDYVLAYLGLWTSPKQGKTALGESYLASARQVLGGQAQPSHGRPYALDLMVRGVHALHEGQFTLAAQQLDAAIAFYEASGRRGSFEHLYCWLYRQYAAHHGHDLSNWRPVLEAAGREIEDGQESALRCHVGIARMRLELLTGDLEGAQRAGRDTLLTWPQDEPSYQRFLMHLGMLSPAIYAGDGIRARTALSELLREHARFLPISNMLGSDLLSHLAIFEAEALRRHVPGASRRKIEAWARRAEQAVPMGRHMAMRAAAYAADYAGEPSEALRWLERAESRAHGVGQSIDVAVARYQRGIRLGGSAGAELVQSAQQLLARTHAHPMLLHEDPARR